MHISVLLYLYQTEHNISHLKLLCFQYADHEGGDFVAVEEVPHSRPSSEVCPLWTGVEKQQDWWVDAVAFHFGRNVRVSSWSECN